MTNERGNGNRYIGNGAGMDGRAFSVFLEALLAWERCLVVCHPGLMRALSVLE